MLTVTIVEEEGLVTKDGTFYEGRLIKSVNRGLWGCFLLYCHYLFYFELTLSICVWR